MTGRAKGKAWGKWLGMHLLFVVYSMSTVISRKIADAAFGSREFIIGYLLIFLCLGIYALGWQQVLKWFSLSQAFANKAAVVIWGMIWGRVIFGEGITWAKMAGAALILAGVLLFAGAESGPEGKAAQR